MHGDHRSRPFSRARYVEVGEERLSAPRIFINVGGRALVPNLPGVDEVSFLTNSTILKLDLVPEHLVVVGGSYVGLEFAQMYRRFGARVTVVEMGPRLIGREDEDMSQAVREILEGEGIAVRIGAECITLAPHADGIAVGVRVHAKATPRLSAPMCCSRSAGGPIPTISASKRPGVATDDRGYIQVDDELATNVPGIWALGDCNGRGAFTHTAYNDFEIVAANLLDGETRRVSDRILGYALYIDPPLGRVGMTDAQARASGRSCWARTRPMSRVGARSRKGRDPGVHEDRCGRRDPRRSSARRSSARAATLNCTAYCHKKTYVQYQWIERSFDPTSDGCQ